MEDPGVAIVGTGFMGWVHTEALRRINVPIVGILGSSLGKSRLAASNLSIPRAYEDLSELVADPYVTSVHISSPNHCHFEQVRKCLEHGKHVLCEKPLAMNSVESKRLVELASQTPDVVTGVNYNLRFSPLCMEARERITTGSLGDIRHITGSYTQDWLSKDSDYNWRILSEEGGELRAVADIGTHWFDLVSSISGLEVESVCADLHTVFKERRRPLGEVTTFSENNPDSEAFQTFPVETEDFGAILLRFKGGARGTVFVSQVSPGRKNCLRYEIAGAEATLAWDSEVGNEMWIGYRDKANETLIRDPALLSAPASAIASYPGGHNEGYADTFKQCFKSFYDYIAHGDYLAERPFASFSDGYREILLCEAILKSHRKRCWVEIGE